MPLVSSLYSSCSGRRQASSPVSRRRARDLAGPLVVVGDQRRVGGAERDQDRAGERRQVDDPLGAELAHAVGERVGEDQPALGVGVVDLDRLAVELGDDVAGLDRASRSACSRSTGIAATRSSSSPSSAIGAERLEHRGAARHVHLHLLHPGRGLDRDPAAVEGDRLADEPDPPRRRRRPSSAARSAAARPRLPRGDGDAGRPSRARRSPRGRGPRPRPRSCAAAISRAPLGQRARG